MKKEDLLNKVFRCKSNDRLYRVVEISPYKDENTDKKNGRNGWIDMVKYVPLYECDIENFNRSLTMFLDKFEEEK